MKYRLIDTHTGKELHEFGLYCDVNGVVRDKTHRIAKGVIAELVTDEKPAITVTNPWLHR